MDIILHTRFTSYILYEKNRIKIDKKKEMINVLFKKITTDMVKKNDFLWKDK